MTDKELEESVAKEGIVKTYKKVVDEKRRLRGKDKDCRGPRPVLPPRR